MAVKYNREKISRMSPYRISQEFSEKEIRAAYNKFRKEWRDRYREFENSEYKGNNRIEEANEMYKQTLKKSDVTAVVHALSSITSFLGQKESTLEGQRASDEMRIRTLQNKGYTMIKTREDLISFGKFMQSVRPYFDAVNVYSERVTGELYQYAKENNISIVNIQRNFDFYRQNIDTILEADLTVKAGKRKGSARRKKWTAKSLADELGLEWEG